MKRISAFTLIEMLVVISIIAILAAFAVPALTSALVRGQMTGSMNNTRQLYLAGQQMALDGTTNSDPTLGWPGDITTPAAITALSAYCDKLISNNYLQAADLKKILSAPSINVAFTGGTTAADGTYTPIAGLTTPALKVYKVQDNNASNTIFAVTSNYTYDTALTAAAKPFADKGFIVQRKGGDAALLRKAQATGTGSTFQALVGRIPGDADGTVGTENSASGGNVLTSN
jgi:prepilin-type N-terminal cleavage/methylation domain-containing protein